MGKQKKSGQAKAKKNDAAFTKRKKKVGKKLVKTNETVISIKTRKIALPTQHDEKSGQYVFKGKSVSEYLTGTKHTNGNHRVQNIVGLQDMLSSNSNLINESAGAIIERLAVLLQDPEDNVRASALVLIKTVLHNISESDLCPFLQVFITQLSSGMLHIEKAVQKTNITALLALLQSHLTNSMTHSEILITALCTLLSTTKNKQNLLLYFQSCSSILKFFTHTDEHKPKDKRYGSSSVLLYKHTSRTCVVKSQTPNTDQLVTLCQKLLPHIETIWLEDVPAQIYAQAEPNSLRTCAALVGLLSQVHRSNLPLSTTALVKVNSITKSISSRFPLICSVSNRDTAVLWSLNMKIANFLVLSEKYSKVERYFVSYFKSRLQELTPGEVGEALNTLLKILDPSPETRMELRTLTRGTHGAQFLAHFVRTGWGTEPGADFMDNLKDNIREIGGDVISSYHHSRRSFNFQIFSLCLDTPVYSSLSESCQIKCLELLHFSRQPVPARTLSEMGKVSRSPRVRARFHGILAILLQEERLPMDHYISILLTEANRDDEDDDSPTASLSLVTDFTLQLLAQFDLLPAPVKRHLLPISLTQLVERLYSGLSHFSLAAYLIILLRFTHLSVTLQTAPPQAIQATPYAIHTPPQAIQTPPHSIQTPPHAILRLSKIIASLIFNKDSLSDWGAGIVKLATTLSLHNPDIWRYITSQMNLETKQGEVVFWYLTRALKMSTGTLSVAPYREGVRRLYGWVQGRVSEYQRCELELRIKMMESS